MAGTSHFISTTSHKTGYSKPWLLPGFAATKGRPLNTTFPIDRYHNPCRLLDHLPPFWWVMAQRSCYRSISRPTFGVYADGGWLCQFVNHGSFEFDQSPDTLRAASAFKPHLNRVLDLRVARHQRISSQVYYLQEFSALESCSLKTVADTCKIVISAIIGPLLHLRSRTT